MPLSVSLLRFCLGADARVYLFIVCLSKRLSVSAAVLPRFTHEASNCYLIISLKNCTMIWKSLNFSAAATNKIILILYVYYNTHTVKFKELSWQGCSRSNRVENLKDAA